MATHKLRSASKAPRWSRCAGSPLAAESPPSVFSAEGTAAHSLAAACLYRGDSVKAERDELWSVEGFTGVFTASDLAAIDAYIFYVRRVPGWRYYEIQLDLPDERGGTADTVILDIETRRITVIDFKMGRGVKVDAKGNEQLLEYATGALKLFDLCGYFDTVIVAIAQPRMDNWPEFPYTRDEILEHDARMRVAAWETRQPGAKRTPGPIQCKWCPIKGSCAERANQFLNMFPITEIPV
jgi:Protein of unknown function (DUF2800)